MKTRPGSKVIANKDVSIIPVLHISLQTNESFEIVLLFHLPVPV